MRGTRGRRGIPPFARGILVAMAGATERWRRRQTIAGDASERRYERLWDGAGRTVVRAQYPARARATLARDLEVATWLAERQVRVPRVLDFDLEGGWVVLEDFGARDAALCLEATAPVKRPPLVDHLLEPLECLAALDPAHLPRWNPPLDQSRMRWELAGFELWFVRHLARVEPSPSLGRWLDGLSALAASHPVRVCHRDYHLNNLFLLPSGEVGVIDAQDILVGPDTYDLASLLFERAMPELLDRRSTEWCLERWAERSAAAPGWRSRVQVLRVQRGLKVLGTFARLVVSGRRRYRAWLETSAAALVSALDPLDPPAALTDLLLDWEAGEPVSHGR